jgi:hypothetical protein
MNIEDIYCSDRHPTNSGAPWSTSSAVIEDSQSFAGNASKQAREVSAATGLPAALLVALVGSVVPDDLLE